MPDGTSEAQRSLARILEAERAARGRLDEAAEEAHEREPEGGTPYLELALDLSFHRRLVALVDDVGGADRSDAIRLVGLPLARANLAAAARCRATASIRPEEIVSFTLHRDFGGGVRALQRIAAGGRLAPEAAALGIDLGAAETAEAIALPRCGAALGAR
jgi:hypothetical protein